MDDELTNYDVWMFNIQDVCNKQNWCNVLISATNVTDKLEVNNSKNITLLMNHTMNERIRHFVLKDDAFTTYISSQAYRPKGNEQNVEILECVQTISSADMKLYVQWRRSIQTRLIHIDPKREHPDTKNPAYMKRQIGNVSNEKTKELFWFRDQWRSRDEATNLDCFQVGKNCRSFFTESGSEYAQVVYGKKDDATGSKSINSGPPAVKNSCGIPHSACSTHSWTDCYSNPINAQKKMNIGPLEKTAPLAQGTVVVQVLTKLS